MTHSRSRTTGTPVLPVNCQAIARRAGTNAAIDPSLAIATLPLGAPGAPR